MRSGQWSWLVCVCATALLAPACADEDDDFVATAAAVQSFRSWASFYLDADPIPAAHVDGPRWAYINRMPPPGATEFPPGTIIVKTVQSGDASSWQVHAMSKRGGTFNADGCLGWEWFDLRVTPSEQVDIVWRGAAPPGGFGYEGPGPGGFDTACNSCHGAWVDINDCVIALPLQLDTLAPASTP